VMPNLIKLLMLGDKYVPAGTKLVVSVLRM
jgi:hypothetical protein